MKFRIKSPYLLGYSLFAVIAAELIGSLASFTSLTTWYALLRKPLLTPPGFVFGIVWGILYLVMGLALYLVWRKEKSKNKWAVRIFFLHLVLNVSWSIYFFGLRSIIGGLVDIVLMIISLFVTLILFYRISKTAAYLLLPYLLWIFFATYLNVQVLLLNK